MVLEKPVVVFVKLDPADTISTSTGGVTSCKGETADMNNCHYIGEPDDFMGHSGIYDGGCNKYSDNLEN